MSERRPAYKQGEQQAEGEADSLLSSSKALEQDSVEEKSSHEIIRASALGSQGGVRLEGPTGCLMGAPAAAAHQKHLEACKQIILSPASSKHPLELKILEWVPGIVSLGKSVLGALEAVGWRTCDLVQTLIL